MNLYPEVGRAVPILRALVPVRLATSDDNKLFWANGYAKVTGSLMLEDIGHQLADDKTPWPTNF